MEFDYASRIIEAATTAAVHGSLLCRIPNRPIRTHVEAYWQASKSRQAHWAVALSLIERREQRGTRSLSERWTERAEGLIEEVLAGDVFTRVCTKLLQGLAAPWWSELDCFAHSVMLGQLETRARVLRFMLESPLINDDHGMRLDKLRRAAERWTDLLLGYLRLSESDSVLAFDRERAREFQATFHEGPPGRQQAALSLLVEGVVRGAERLFRTRCPHPELNCDVALSILSCLGPDILDAVGPHAQLWQTRLQRNAHEISYWLTRLNVEPVNGWLP